MKIVELSEDIWVCGSTRGLEEGVIAFKNQFLEGRAL